MAKRSSGNIETNATLAVHKESLMGSQRLVAFVATRDPGRAKAFYRDSFDLVSEDEFAVVFDAAGTMLRITQRSRSRSSEIYRFGVTVLFTSPTHRPSGSALSNPGQLPGRLLRVTPLECEGSSRVRRYPIVTLCGPA